MKLTAGGGRPQLIAGVSRKKNMRGPTYKYSGSAPCVDICVSLRFSEALIARRVVEGSSLAASGAAHRGAVAVMPVWPTAQELGEILTRKLVPESGLHNSEPSASMCDIAQAPDYTAFFDYYWPFTVWRPPGTAELALYGTIDFEEADLGRLQNLETPCGCPFDLAEPILSFMKDVIGLLEASRGERWGLAFARTGDSG